MKSSCEQAVAKCRELLLELTMYSDLQEKLICKAYQEELGKAATTLEKATKEASQWKLRRGTSPEEGEAVGLAAEYKEQAERLKKAKSAFSTVSGPKMTELASLLEGHKKSKRVRTL